MDYKKLLEKAKSAYDKCTTGAEKRRLESIFPELKESEDERMIRIIEDAICTNEAQQLVKTKYGLDLTDLADWLEKQCGVDNVPLEGSVDAVVTNSNKSNHRKPKLKVGDWVVKNDGEDCFTDGSYVLQITSIDDMKYYNLSNGNYLVEPFNATYRPWTIEDAKDGDVLAYNDGSLALFHYRLRCLDAGLYMSHVLLTDKIEIKQTSAISNVHPATKEQRDLLFQKIHEAGYEWDAEKKELKDILKKR